MDSFYLQMNLYIKSCGKESVRRNKYVSSYDELINAVDDFEFEIEEINNNTEYSYVISNILCRRQCDADQLHCFIKLNQDYTTKKPFEYLTGNVFKVLRAFTNTDSPTLRMMCLCKLRGFGFDGLEDYVNSELATTYYKWAKSQDDSKKYYKYDIEDSIPKEMEYDYIWILKRNINEYLKSYLYSGEFEPVVFYPFEDRDSMDKELIHKILTFENKFYSTLNEFRKDGTCLPNPEIVYKYFKEFL